jgi:hypothetical protein
LIDDCLKQVLINFFHTIFAQFLIDFILLLPEAGKITCLQFPLKILEMALVKPLPLERVFQGLHILLRKERHQLVNFLLREILDNIAKIDNFLQIDIEQFFGKWYDLPLMQNIHLSCIKDSIFLAVHGVQLLGDAFGKRLNFYLERFLDIAVHPGAVVVVLGFVE